MNVYDNGVQAKAHFKKIGCGDWKESEKIEAHVSASYNPSYAKKRCIVCGTRTFRSWTIFCLSYGHCPVPWCPDRGTVLRRLSMAKITIKINYLYRT